MQLYMGLNNKGGFMFNIGDFVTVFLANKTVTALVIDQVDGLVNVIDSSEKSVWISADRVQLQLDIAA